MRDRFLIFGQPLLEQEEIDEVVDSMKKGWIGTGPKVHRFESDFAAYKGVDFAAAVNSCTAALHLACIGLELGAGDEVITTAMTFCASINAIIHSGATPVLADIERDSLNIDVLEIEKKITTRTKAILVVHFAGRPCAMDSISALATKHGLLIIEDCAHAIETEYHGRKAGTIGDLGCFSFYATKNLTTSEGGMLIGRDQRAIEYIKTLALHGLSADAWNRFSDAGYKHYRVEHAGFKYNMTDLQAAIGIHQLRRIEENWLRRQAIWNRYLDAFSDLPLGLPAAVEPGTRHAHHLFTIRIDEQKTGISRDAFLDAMTAQQIGVGVHYLSIPEHPYYQKAFGWQPEDYPVAMAYGRETVSLPLAPKLSDRDVSDVIAAVKTVLCA
jgi:dTDP-4-amino-4,6-dideoxygalactose transaminase